MSLTWVWPGTFVTIAATLAIAVVVHLITPPSLSWSRSDRDGGLR